MYTIQFTFSKSDAIQAQPVMQTVQTAKPLLSPCIGVCEMRPDGLCGGCLRTLDEIAGWSALSDAAREQLMQHDLPARE